MSDLQVHQHQPNDIKVSLGADGNLDVLEVKIEL
jgi:hypothetical protein